MSVVASEAPERLFERVQELQDRLDGSGADPAIVDLTGELVSAVVEMYGEGLARILASPEGERLATSLTEDPVVATLLLIHDLHPVPLAQRVQGALDTVRPYMESHGGNVELLSVEDGVARIHLRGSCSDCSASSVTLELAVKRALEEAAPDLAGLEVEGMAPQMTGLGLPMANGDGGGSGAELPMVMSGPGSDPTSAPGPTSSAPPAALPTWVELDSVGGLELGGLTAVAMGGGEFVVANVEGTLLAYRDRCAACGGSLHDGALTEGALACPHCQRSFFLPRAGRSLDDEQLQLEPVPLLREQGRVKVALAAT
jgi:Fe-S cluster biogenesis protein NfuA/nitrite reductase/ring-hydroxylating ferredoxin subunit